MTDAISSSHNQNRHQYNQGISYYPGNRPVHEPEQSQNQHQHNQGNSYKIPNRPVHRGYRTRNRNGRSNDAPHFYNIEEEHCRGEDKGKFVRQYTATMKIPWGGDGHKLW